MSTIGFVEQPGGVVTFMFTDVEDSTQLWNADPETMRAALALHDEVLRGRFADHEGYVFATGGDGFGVAFASTARAVECSLAIQAALATVAWPSPAYALRVRIGLDIGEAQQRDDDYFGPVVNRCARIAAVSHGGQVLASEAVALIAGVEAKPMGVHRLRGFGSPTSLWQVGAGEFGRLHTVRNVGNLPRPPTEFIGRRDEVSELVAAAPHHRLTTLTGVGGVGKTRLAVEVCRQLADDCPDGVFFFDLAAIGDPDAVIDLVISVLSIPPAPSTSPTETALEWLARRRTALLFDNCEHVIDAVAELTEQILARSEALVIATSREALRIGGEHIWPVRPLAQARDLFIERAIASRPDFEPVGVEEIIDEICTRLDRIPLAIELAAARCRMMSVSEVSDRLLDRFELLRGSGRGGIERHQTMQTTIRWSYDMLSTDQRALFDRLCVFPADFDRAAASAVCAPGGSEPRTISDALDALVDQSMLFVHSSGAATRYRLLETFRQFGETQIEPDLLRELRHRHLAYYVERVKRTAEDYNLAEAHESSAATFAAEWANLRACMYWAIANRDAQACRALLENLWRYATFSLIHEFGEWAIEALDLEPCPNTVRVVAGWAFNMRGDADRALELTSEAARIDPDDPYALGVMLGTRARAAGMTDSEFVGLAKQLPDLARRRYDAPGPRAIALAIAANLLALGDPDHSDVVAAEAEGLLAHGVGCRNEAQARGFLARWAQLRNASDAARSYCTEARKLTSHLTGRFWSDQISMHVEADVALTHHDTDAPTVASAALEAVIGAGNWYDGWAILEPIATWLHESGEDRAAAIIAGFFDEHGIGCRVPQRAAVFLSLLTDPNLQARVEQGRNIDKTELVDQIHAFLVHKSPTHANE